MTSFLKTLRTQRWDDHRYYHQSRINQSLHLISALSFLLAYVYLLIDPAVSGWIAWVVAMSTRQIGHFVFEPTGFDTVNNVSNDYKESVKVGYNLRRKVVLLSVCALIPALAYWKPDALSWAVPSSDAGSFFDLVGMSWIVLGLVGIGFRVIQIWLRSGWLEGLAWASKIITDPFHDIVLYHKAPYYLLKGQWLDPMAHVRAR